MRMDSYEYYNNANGTKTLLHGAMSAVSTQIETVRQRLNYNEECIRRQEDIG